METGHEKMLSVTGHQGSASQMHAIGTGGAQARARG